MTVNERAVEAAAQAIKRERLAPIPAATETNQEYETRLSRAALTAALPHLSPDWDSVIEACAQKAFEKSAMLPHDSDFSRGYACGREGAGTAIRSLKSTDAPEKGK